MIARLILDEFRQNRTSAVGKVAVPFVFVAMAGIAGYAGLALVMLLIFAGVLGAGMSIVRLKTSGLYDRLIASPAGKPALFLEIAGAESLLLMIQYIPAMAGAAWFTGPSLILPAVLSILFVVVIGISVGIVAKGIGEMHLYGIMATLPLLLATFVPFQSVRILPFPMVLDPGLAGVGAITPWIALIAFYSLFLAGVSRL